MNLFELLTFVGCVAVGIELATAYGECMSGKIAYYLIGHVLAAIGIRSISWLLNIRRWFFSDFPPCENAEVYLSEVLSNHMWSHTSTINIG